MKNISFLAALLAFVGVSLGAFGAHALKERLAEAAMTSTWQTAVLYHLLHTVAAWGAGLPKEGISPLLRRAAWCWLIGILLFSGSLYLLALGGPRWLGPITPVGGLFFLAGWAIAAIAAFKRG